MRHLFIEHGYCSAQVLNEWMRSDSDELLMVWYDNLEGTLAHSECTLDFYRAIKNRFPKTVLHGVDVEHQYDTTGVLYMNMLKNRGMENSAEYQQAADSFSQGNLYYSLQSEAWRENKMTENFIREFDALPESEKIMGIFGGAHCGLHYVDKEDNVPCMANQLNKHYQGADGGLILSKDLRKMKGARRR